MLAPAPIIVQIELTQFISANFTVSQGLDSMFVRAFGTLSFPSIADSPLFVGSDFQILEREADTRVTRRPLGTGSENNTLQIRS